MGLKIIVVGAGIAGLTTAIALRQAGHSVTIFEKSKFATEVGAALGLTPNGAQVLVPLGFSFERARARPITSWDIADGVSLKVLNSMDLTESAKRFGFPTYAVHRVDMHNELLQLAREPGENGEEAVQLRLAARVVGGDAGEGWVALEDGERHYADLIVGADGVHSALRAMVVGSDKVKPVATGLSAFRFLISTKKMREDPALEELLKWKSAGASTLANLADPVPERHMMWYDCQDGEVQNFVGVHPSREVPINEDGKPDFKAAMLEDFDAYHPDLKHVIRRVLSDLASKMMLMCIFSIADEVSCWPLNIHEPLSTWTNGKMVLVGDAAHPMLPFGGQGSNQAIEDAGALGRILSRVSSLEELQASLEVFQSVRIGRASAIQTLSKVRVGREMDVEQEVKQYFPPGAKVPSSFPERSAHAFSHNVLKAADEALEAVNKQVVAASTSHSMPCTTEETQPPAANSATALTSVEEAFVATKEVLTATQEALKTLYQALNVANQALLATKAVLMSMNKALLEKNDQVAAAAIKEKWKVAAAHEMTEMTEMKTEADTALWTKPVVKTAVASDEARCRASRGSMFRFVAWPRA